MERVPDDEPLVVEAHAVPEEEEAADTRIAPRGGSNSRALKVAALTTLACLLVASQVFTAYMLFDQKQEIVTLRGDSERLGREMNRPWQDKPMRKLQPVRSLPLLRVFDPDEDFPPVKPKTPQPEVPQDAAGLVHVEDQLMDLMQDFKRPQFTATFLENLRGLKEQINETDWESLESWMRNWLTFQLAQQKHVLPTPTYSTIKTKCQVEATADVSKIGTYKPQCDEEGRYLPVQCWHATGFCWCVDDTGAAVPGTQQRGRPRCPQAEAVSLLDTPKDD